MGASVMAARPVGCTVLFGLGAALMRIHPRAGRDDLDQRANALIEIVDVEVEGFELYDAGSVAIGAYPAVDFSHVGVAAAGLVDDSGADISALATAGRAFDDAGGQCSFLR